MSNLNWKMENDALICFKGMNNGYWQRLLRQGAFGIRSSRVDGVGSIRRSTRWQAGVDHHPGRHSKRADSDDVPPLSRIAERPGRDPGLPDRARYASADERGCDQ